MSRSTAVVDNTKRCLALYCCTPHLHARSQLLLAYGNVGDVEGIQSVMTRAGNEVFTGGVMNALVYESVLRVLASLEAWQDAETFVKVRGGGWAGVWVGVARDEEYFRIEVVGGSSSSNRIDLCVHLSS